ncbi:type II secretion system protein J [Marinospirillum sp.]|uniref:PulJ/GspJ family protein n=1 Tax=Marinospirillum sp. TaxID=2183934 RepID=UPI00384DFDB6
MMKSRQTNHGFSLVEMLVALALGALMMAGIASSFTAITQAQQLTRDYEQVQETLRFTTSLISRSLRTAEKLVDETGVAETSNNRFSVERENAADRRSCNGQTPTENFYETYYLDTASNQLVCRVSSTNGSNPDWAGQEVIAYGIESFNLKCVLYDPRREITEDDNDYGPCSGITDHAEVIALKVTLEFDTGEFMQLESYPNHTFTATLRSHLRGCAQNGTNETSTKDVCKPDNS